MDFTKKDYSGEDLEESLRRAFVDGGADFIVFDGDVARTDFLRDGILYGEEKGWLVKGKEVKEEQWTSIEYRLNEEGKAHFGVD